MKPFTQDEIITKINNFYPQYITDKVIYTNANNYITLTCPEHGDFRIIPYKMFKNNIPLCPSCKRKYFDFRVTNTELFIKKSKIIFGDTYDYSKSQYINNSSEITITCKKHGDFSLIVDEHLSAQRGCPLCAKDRITSNYDDFVEKATKKHNGYYSYPKFDYINSDQIIDILCPRHGLYKQKISTHLLGYKCKKCNSSTTEEFIKKATKKYNNYYNYDKVDYINNRTPITVTCPVHGDYTVTPANHLTGMGCLICQKDERNKIYLKEFIFKATRTHNGKYNYDKSKYNGRYTYTTITCPIHGDFTQEIGVHLQGSGCQKCAYETQIISSSYEDELIEFIRSINPNIKITPNHRISNKEIDIYLPEYNLGIEINGMYWHSHKFKTPQYHKEKSDLFEQHGIQIFHMWEYQWVNILKKEIIKSMIKNKLANSVTKIYARKCEIKLVSSKKYREFCDTNHIQGYSPSLIKLGLYYNGELVSCMGFGHLRVNMGNKISNTNKWELVRFCNKLNCNIVGGASRLLKYFETNYNPKYLVSYADRDYSNGNLYNILNFTNKGISNISYSYYNNSEKTIKNRFCYRKSELIKLGYSPDLTEFEITDRMGLYRIYNSGTIKFIKEYN